MRNFLVGIQIVSAIALMAAILIQARGTGFGRGWGSSGASFTRRGLEKVVFRLTFVIVAIFIFVSVLQLTI